MLYYEIYDLNVRGLTTYKSHNNHLKSCEMVTISSCSHSICYAQLH